MIQKIRDTLIGLWPVIKTYVPTVGLIVAVAVAFLIGLLWGYALDPVSFYDSSPRTLGQGWQDEWVRLVADRYKLATSVAVPSEEFRQSLISLLRSVDDPQEIVNRLGLLEISDLAAEAQVGAPVPPERPNIIGTLRPWVLGPILLVVGFVVGSLLFGFYINPMLIEPIRKKMRGARGTDAVGAAEINRIKADKAERDRIIKEAATAPVSDLGPPVVTHVSTYAPGRAYDDSFSIEDAKKDDEFLGECGAVISETATLGNDKVSAIEVWLFDKDDFTRTLTSVFVSEFAYNDPATRSSLETKGPLIIVKPGAMATLETNTLLLQATVMDVVYGTGPLPANSYFDRVSIKLQAWRRAPGSAPSPAPAIPATAAPAFTPVPYTPPATPVYSPPPVAAPPAAPSYTPPAMPPAAPSFAPPPVTPAQTYGGGITPLRPAPIQKPPPPADNDPFDGAGDFTPLGR